MQNVHFLSNLKLRAGYGVVASSEVDPYETKGTLLSVGLPVICSRIRGNVDLIENGKGDFIYDCHDVN